jgi:hypothetical protein
MDQDNVIRFGLIHVGYDQRGRAPLEEQSRRLLIADARRNCDQAVCRHVARFCIRPSILVELTPHSCIGDSVARLEIDYLRTHAFHDARGFVSDT